MKSIVITGGIGCGKGYVANHLWLKDNFVGYKIDFDCEWHKQLKNQQVREVIIEKFGKFIVEDERAIPWEIFRKKLANIVFSSQSAMKEYMMLISPFVKEMEKNILNSVEDRKEFAILEIPVAFQCVPMDSISRENFVFVGIFVSKETQIRRIIERSKFNLTRLQAEERIAMQPSFKEYMHKCDVCFWNEDGSNLDELTLILEKKIA